MRKAALFVAIVLFAVLLSSCHALSGYGRLETITTMPGKASAVDAAIYSADSVPEDIFYDIPAPDFELINEEGQTVTLADLKGDVVVLCFFATWSRNCLNEFEFLSQAQSDFPEVSFFAVNTGERRDMTVEENKRAVIDIARENGLTLPILFDEDSSVYDLSYNMSGELPSVFIIDSQRKIRNIISGCVTGYDELKPYVSSVEELENNG